MSLNKKMLKKDIQAYLDKNKIPYRSSATKEELLKLAEDIKEESDVEPQKSNETERPIVSQLPEKPTHEVKVASGTKPLATIVPSKPSKKAYFVGGIVGIVLGGLAVFGLSGVASPQNVASYNGGTLSALKVVSNSASTTATQSLVRNEVVNGILINLFGDKQANKEANKAYAKVVSSYGSTKKALAALTENGYTESTYKKMVVQSYLMNKYVKDKYITSTMATKAYSTWTPDQGVYVKASTTSAAPKVLKQLKATSSTSLSTFFTRNGFTAYNVGSSTELSASALSKITSLKNGESASVSMGSSNVLIVYMAKKVDKTTYTKDKDALYTSLASQYLKDTSTKSKIVSQLFDQGNLHISNSILDKGVRNVSSSTSSTN